MLIIDTVSGTILDAQHCVYLSDDILNDTEELEDYEICDIANEQGKPVVLDIHTVDMIANTLNGNEWSSNTLNTVVDLVRCTGRTIEDI